MLRVSSIKIEELSKLNAVSLTKNVFQLRAERQDPRQGGRQEC